MGSQLCQDVHDKGKRALKDDAKDVVHYNHSKMKIKDVHQSKVEFSSDSDRKCPMYGVGSSFAQLYGPLIKAQ